MATTSTLRRAIPSMDPRSPLALSNLTIPQHQILTSFHSLPTVQESPSKFVSPSPFASFANSPVISSPSSRVYYDSTFPSFSASPTTPATKSSLKFLLQTGRVPSLMVGCPCGNGRQTTKHIMKECKRFEGEREGLMSKSPKTPRTPRSPREKEVLVMHAARKWRMKALLGRYKGAVGRSEKASVVQVGGQRVKATVIQVGGKTSAKADLAQIEEMAGGKGIFSKR